MTAKSSAQPAASRADAPRRSTRREIEAWLLACAAEGRTFQLRNEHDGGGALLALRAASGMAVLAQVIS